MPRRRRAVGPYRHKVLCEQNVFFFEIPERAILKYQMCLQNMVLFTELLFYQNNAKLSVK
jgi:hypothetical protein